MLEPPVAIQAFCHPSVVMQVPLEENEASPGKAGGILRAIESQVVPSLVRISGNSPLTESLVRDAAIRSPEREAVTEGVHGLIRKLSRSRSSRF